MFKRVIVMIAMLVGVGAELPTAKAEGVVSDLIRPVLELERRNLLKLPPQSLEAYLTNKEPKNAFGKIYAESYLDELPSASGGTQWKCLTQALYFEARGESVKGVFAVGEVILNRVKSKRFPNKVCKVVNQGTGRKYACQFSYTCDGRAEDITEPDAHDKMGKIARLLMDVAPKDLTFGATFYHTTAVNPSWASVFDQTVKIGDHIFYRRNVRTAQN